MPTLFYSMWYLLITVAVLFLISGLDDSFFDVFYWLYLPYRKWKTRSYSPLNIDKLFSVPEKKVAVLIACWHEPSIGRMLAYNVNEIKYQQYDIFVGVYPNDPDTIRIVEAVQKYFSNVHCVISPKPGPTTKAQNLNSIYHYIKNHEKKHRIEYEAYVMHDAEDVIDPIAFKLYNYIIPRKDMVQLPVIPLPVSLRNITHWTYNDEFSEIHTKDIVVREAIGGFIPSAGVGTAFSKKALDVLKEHNNGEPFSLISLTEDYSSALKIKIFNLSSIFMLFWVPRIVEKRSWLLLGKKINVTKKIISGTRSLFTMTYEKSLRQRTRWVIGIVFQEWYNTGWPGNWATKYSLFHDRKVAVSHVVNFLCYVSFVYWTFYFVWSYYHPGIMTLNIMLDLHPWVWNLMLICTIFMTNRIIQRMIATCRIYDWKAMITSPLRIVYANILYMHVLVRAYLQFFVENKPRKSPKWDKTDNTFPAENMLENYKWQIGDILLKNRDISKTILVKALQKQQQTGKQLEEILLNEKHIQPKTLLSALSIQHNLEIIDPDNISILSWDKIADIQKATYDWLIENAYLPVMLENDRVKIVFSEFPSVETKNTVRQSLLPYQATFGVYVASEEPLVELV